MASDPNQIAYCQIHPGVGIARVGNSPDEYFIGPESPGHVAQPGQEKFKDAQGRIKRQAARFRIYAYNADGVAIRELTAGDANIAWTVQLANKKASYYTFLGKYWALQYSSSNLGGVHPLRNQEVKDPAQRAARLDITPGPQTVTGANATSKPMTGTFGPLKYTIANTDAEKKKLEGSRSGFMNQPLNGDGPKGPPDVLEPSADSPQLDVYLGELRTDLHGRLLVLGGLGESRSVIPDNPIGFLNTDSYYANNDYWHDDVSDGRVHAEVTLKTGEKIEVRGESWVIVTPPKFAPHAEVLTTLWDCAEYSASQRWPDKYPQPATISFTRDIYPIMRRISEYQWFNQYAYSQHGTGMVFDMFEPTRFLSLHRNLVGDKQIVGDTQMRQRVFKRMRPPLQVMEKVTGKKVPDVLIDPRATQYASMDYMPQMNGDGGATQVNTNENIAANETLGGIYTSFNALIPSQYEAMRRWSLGDFVDDWPEGLDPIVGPPAPPMTDDLPVAEQPRALDRASLEPCAGGSFYPGIEITYICVQEDIDGPEGTLWSDLGRFDTTKLEPGDITKHMALPWQADFSECRYRWWPAQRPDDIVSEAQYNAVVQSYDQKLDGPLPMALANRELWTRGLPQDVPHIDNHMITAWRDLGFVVPKQ
ncbi:MAG TPA: LodA/GoxA family CTQ-dependent oxidase, partial [Thermoanaerobaculia bacterium]|nr:LodA/GoxA family CTQ-dependent oxidase [Thermoanaerobaculia bacterium]